MSWNGWGIWGSQAGRGTWHLGSLRGEPVPGRSHSQAEQPQAASRSRALVLATVWNEAWEVFYFFFWSPWSHPWWHKSISAIQRQMVWATTALAAFVKRVLDVMPPQSVSVGALSVDPFCSQSRSGWTGAPASSKATHRPTKEVDLTSSFQQHYDSLNTNWGTFGAY